MKERVVIRAVRVWKTRLDCICYRCVSVVED